ncbi:DNA-directed DNA polymerase delta [Lobulomyces angularis]|nr:DNA-directed DNA polymerase delta [Lobulomyces angularis]
MPLVYVYDWLDISVENEHELLIFCYNSSNERCILRIVDNIDPYIYILYSDIVDSNKDMDENELESYLVKKYSLGYNKYLYRNIKIEQKRFLRRTNGLNEDFVRISFSNNEYKNSVVNMFNYKNINVYHSDISTHLDFICNKDIQLIGTVKIDYVSIVSEESKITNIEKEYIVEYNHINKTNETMNIPYFRIVSFDIETQSHDLVSFPNMYDPRDYISVIGLTFVKNNGSKWNEDIVERYAIHCCDVDIEIEGSTIIRTKDEIELIDKFFELLIELDVDIITGYNIYNYDYKYVYRRYSRFLNKKYNISLLKNQPLKVNERNNVSKKWSGTSLIEYDIPGISSIDLFQYVCMKFPNLHLKNLDYVSKKFTNYEKTPLSVNKIFEYIASNDKESVTEVVKYCIQDTFVTLAIFININTLINCIEMCNTCYISLNKYLITGSIKKYNNQLINICTKNNYIANEQQMNIRDRNEGGAVMDPIPGMHKNCAILDFKSLYPSIIIAHNICPTTYIGKNNFNDLDCHIIPYKNEKHYFIKSPIGLIPSLCKELLSKRDEIKKDMKNIEYDTIEYIMLDSRQNLLKIIANSIYGCYSSGYVGIATFREGAECITEMGRKYLHDTKDILENQFNYTVVYGDTDSCMIVPNDTSIETKDVIVNVNNICKSNVLNSIYTDPIQIKYERIFERVIFVKKKKYVGVDGETGNIYIKGLMRGDICQYAKTVFNKVIDMILKDADKDDICDFYKDKILDLLNNKIPFSELTVKVKVKSSYRHNTKMHTFKENMKKWNINLDIGEEIEVLYVKMSNSKVGEKIRPYMPEYQIKEKLDYNYYIKTHMYSLFKNFIYVYNKNVGDYFNVISADY